MNRMARLIPQCMLSVALLLLAACNRSDPSPSEEEFSRSDQGVFILCEGNYQAGNSTLSYYDPRTGLVENGIFYRANGRKLGDTGQSITIFGQTAYIAVENSGIVWAIDTETFRVRGQLTAGATEKHMINPRYVYVQNASKAYVTDLYAPYITLFNPTTFDYLGAIATTLSPAYGYSNTERIVPFGDVLFVNCWCYSRSILVLDTRRDEVCDSIVLGSWQPKAMLLDCRDKLWVLTDGGYGTESSAFGDNVPHLFRIDAATRRIEADEPLETDEASVEMALNPAGDTLYVINNDLYRMAVTDSHLPVRPFITAPTDEKGRRHKLYGLSVNPHDGDIYLADAVDYSQAGAVYRYSREGELKDHFRVGINPNGFAFKGGF
ncbi:MAG: hypothetical protein K5945_11270 [Bacteroidaceae bacterium]|nr:hypothetical protein [Bacteroidaceae bacterium]